MVTPPAAAVTGIETDEAADEAEVAEVAETAEVGNALVVAAWPSACDASVARTSRQICVGDRMLAGGIVDAKLVVSLKVMNDESKDGAWCAGVVVEDVEAAKSLHTAKQERRFRGANMKGQRSDKKGTQEQEADVSVMQIRSNDRKTVQSLSQPSIGVVLFVA